MLKTAICELFGIEHPVILDGISSEIATGEINY